MLSKSEIGETTKFLRVPAIFILSIKERGDCAVVAQVNLVDEDVGANCVECYQ